MSELPTHPLLYALATAGEEEVPTEAIAQCMRCINEVAPELLAAIARAADAPVTSQAELNLVFYGHYILGAARDKRLQAPLLRLLRLPDDTLDAVIGSEYVTTLASIAIGAFDGDAEALFDLLTDADTSAYVRMVMFGALAYLTWSGQIPADTTSAFLHRFESERRIPAGDTGWNGWETCIELLGWQAFVPLVRAAYDDGRLDTGMSEMRLFLQGVVEAANAAPDDDTRFKHEGYCYIEDVLASIEFPAPLLGGPRDVAFSDDPALDGLVNRDSTGNDDRLGWLGGAYEPRRNPLRHVGRNDPCPCGSGKKYKKCCLAA